MCIRDRWDVEGSQESQWFSSCGGTQRISCELYVHVSKCWELCMLELQHLRLSRRVTFLYFKIPSSPFILCPIHAYVHGYFLYSLLKIPLPINLHLWFWHLIDYRYIHSLISFCTTGLFSRTRKIATSCKCLLECVLGKLKCQFSGSTSIVIEFEWWSWISINPGSIPVVGRAQY